MVHAGGSNKTVKVGLVGCGYWGSKHLRVLNEIPNCEVTALCDSREDNVAKQPRAFLPPLITADYDEFLSANIDAVVIATPARTHYPLVLEALRRDKHVLTEKPFTTSTTEALDLIMVAEQRGLISMVGHTYVYHPAVQFLRNLVESKALGSLHYIHTARLNFGLLQPDVDVLWDLAPHDLSILLHILGEEPLAAGGRGAARINPKLYEVAHVDLEFLNGLFAHIYVSWLEPVKVRRLTFVGSERTVVYDDVASGEMIRLYDKAIKVVEREDGDGELAPVYLQGDVTVPFLPNSEPLKSEDAHFLECVRTGQRSNSDDREGLKVVRILETVQQSLYNGGYQELLTLEAQLAPFESVPMPALHRKGGS